MSDVKRIFDAMPERYRKGSATAPKSFYFSIDEHKYTVKVDPESCEVTPGKPAENADIVLKTSAKIFQNMLKGKMPGPIDIARGKIKTNDPMGLKDLMTMFDLSGV